MTASQPERTARLEARVDNLDRRVDVVEHTANTASQQAVLAVERLDGTNRDLNRVRSNLARTVWTVVGIVAAAVAAAIRFSVR